MSGRTDAPGPGDLSRRLAELLTTPFGARPRISRLTRLAGGASRETWAFDAERDGSHRALILRRDPPGRPGEPGAMGREAQLLGEAGRAGLAVPEVIAVDDGRLLGTEGLVMAHVAGETLARRILREPELAHARAVLVAQCGEFLAGLHAIDPDRIDGLPAVDPLDDQRRRWRELEGVSPTFELALRWLEEHRPAPGREVIVHGDFRLGNMIVDRNGLAAVIDWELAHAGDPLEDLAWMCVKAWRFRGTGAVAGIGAVAELLDAYEGGGGAVDRAAFRWWLVFDTLKWGVICEWQAAAHLTGAQRSVELAAIGRRVAEQEWDLLELLDPDACGQALDDARRLEYDEPGADPPGVYGRPTAQELLAATREFVADEVMPATRRDRPVQFRARVAANALSIVERQLRLGPGQAVRHRAAFEALGVGGVDELAGQVAAGAWDARGDELRPLLAALARDKLAVAEPRHLTTPPCPGDIP